MRRNIVTVVTQQMKLLKEITQLMIIIHNIAITRSMQTQLMKTTLLCIVMQRMIIIQLLIQIKHTSQIILNRIIQMDPPTAMKHNIGMQPLMQIRHMSKIKHQVIIQPTEIIQIITTVLNIQTLLMRVTLVCIVMQLAIVIRPMKVMQLLIKTKQTPQIIKKRMQLIRTITHNTQIRLIQGMLLTLQTLLTIPVDPHTVMRHSIVLLCSST